MSRLVGLAAAVAIATVSLAASAFGNTAVEASVKHGRWQGVKWELRAGAWRDGSYCVAMLLRDREDSRSCGNVRDEGGVSYSARTGRPSPNYVIGPVNTSARSVDITFFDRSPVRVRTIPAPRMLEGGMRFFLTLLPCPATPKRLIAHDAAGRIVARLVVRHFMKASC